MLHFGALDWVSHYGFINFGKRLLSQNTERDMEPYESN